MPLWVYALVLAGLAPWIVQAIANAIERRMKARTDALLRDIDAERDASDAREHRDAAQAVQRDEG